MSKKKAKKNTRRKSGARTTQAKPRRRRDGKQAVRGMLYGGLICAAFAVFFFVRIGGQTPFNHIVMALTPAEPEKAASKNSKSSTGKPSLRIGAKRGTVQTPKAITTNAVKAPPLENTTDKDKEDLDKLLEQKSR